ncbi:Plasmodesmata callose-binding protein 3 [Vitis vinifera]|uniref:Plasmodesmata callose-binding protein 3 n=1 Tax=Vitis vinifera TaxID=29760 RepID=A0A438E326_VITVI|nr:Plasmodesmata callose-binding protein 3 [Vitis vinifera]
MAVLVYFVLFLAMTGHSSAAVYCVCKDGLSDQALQKTLDYACGAGADCSPVLQNGACYNPNTVKDHCSYAVNSYFQKKGQASGSCDFAGTATQSQTNPSSVSTCVYPTSARKQHNSIHNHTIHDHTFHNHTLNHDSKQHHQSLSVWPRPLGSGGITSTDSSAAVAPLHCTDLFFSAALTLWLSGLVLLWG